MQTGTWAEIAITRLKIMDAQPPPGGYSFDHHGGESYGPEKVHVGADLVREIERHAAAGARALLLTISNCEGGSSSAADQVYAALRRISDRGGKVVVYLEGMAASSAAHIALAGDYVLMNRESVFVLHSAVIMGGSGRPAEELERIRLAHNEVTRATALERSAIPPRAIDDALACQFNPAKGLWDVKTLEPDVALEWCWADAISDLEGARAFTRMVAEPAIRFETLRSAMLRVRRGLRARVLGPHAGQGMRPAVDAQCTISANKLTGDALETANYAQDASGNPTAGAKLDSYGTALKVAPANFQIGQTLIRDTWFANQRQVIGRRLTYASGAWTLTSSGLTLGTWNATNKQLRIWGTGAGAAGFNDAVVHATRIDGVTAGYAYELRSGHLNRGSNGTDVWFDVELWRMRAYWDEMLGLQTVCESVDWPGLGASAPWFDISVTFFNGSPTWRWPWQ
ncbi:ATP-dependent Clp protease proteolytic subunit [Anaeromyxobacter sp. Red801]|uniref:ATP-dependent Clp protease proteolytic subunit n=1 Tax=Anaeromyxobacter sp. Red801 TaxID=3411632 RepID=UPI003BA0CB34